MVTEEHCWDILRNNFETVGFVQHQTESFNNFINNRLSQIFMEEPPIVITTKQKDDKSSESYEKYTVSFSDIYVPSPILIEEDRSIHVFYPSEARQRDLTYDSPIYATVTTVLEQYGAEPEIEKNLRVVIGRVPIMLRSSKCYLSNMTPAERIKALECEKDEGGYFIIKGKERVLIPQLRFVYNVPKVFEQKQGDKFKYVAEIRSMSEETGHSALLKAMIGCDDRTLVFSLPYIKENIPIGVVFKSLGYFEDEDVSKLIGINDEKMDRIIKLINRDSFFCVDQTDGFSEFSESMKDKYSSAEISKRWKNLPAKDKNEYKNKATKQNALKFIGQHSMHTLKDSEYAEYALQVVENELFPHMGVTVKNKEIAYYLGHIINKLLSTYFGYRKDDDRDDYINKRVESSGTLCYELVRQLFKKYCLAIVTSIEKKKQSPDAMSVISRLPIITNGLRHCFSTGNWGVPKNSYIRTGVSQVLSRLSYGATLSNLRRVCISIGKESKNTKIRQIHPSQIMFLCPSECFDPETQILLWDGSSKRAGDIVVGDILVDDLGNPTNVRKTCCGIKVMYDVIPEKSNFTKHRVTDNHILTLQIRQHKSIHAVTRKDRKYTHVVKYFDRNENKFSEKYFRAILEAENFVKSFDDDNTLDITIENYLKLNDYTKKYLVLFKIGCVNWETKKVEMDPYLLGMWLGDGLSTGTGFALNYKTDYETLAYWEKWAEANGAIIRKTNKYKYTVVSKENKKAKDLGLCSRVEEAPLKKYLRKYDLINNKHIPNEYLTNDKQTRLNVLAGLIDTDGSVRAKGREIRITQGPCNYQIIDDAHRLCISLGFSCSVREGVSQWTDGDEKKFSTYKELTITGSGIQEIPTLLPRKKLSEVSDKKQIERSKSFMGSLFKLEKVGLGPYVGWQLEDKRGRFSLSCGLACHNTPEGASVGIVLNLSLLTKISEKFPTVLVKEVMEQCDNVIPLDKVDTINDVVKIFVNGSFIGVTNKPYDFVDEVKTFRDIKILPYDVSVNYDNIDQEINICADEGRLLRPVFTVEGDKLKITKEDGIVWDTLVEKNLIKYIDNNEISSAVIAFGPEELTKYHNDYCEIAPAMMLGVMASIIPFPDHSQCIYNQEPVYMADGSIKKICDVRVDDEVITFDPETQQQSITKVSHVYTNKTDKQLFELTTISGRKITATYDHRFMTSEGWCRIEHMTCGETLVGVSTEPKPVSSKVSEEQCILTEKEFTENCIRAGIKSELVKRYCKELAGLLPLKTTNPNLYIISRLMGFISTDCWIGISNKGIVRLAGDFGHEHSVKLFAEDISRLGFKYKQARYTSKEGFGSTYRLEYSGSFPAMFVALGCLFGKKSQQQYNSLPWWIEEGSDMIKREFLAGFQGGDGSKIKSGSDKQIHIHISTTSKNINKLYKNSLIDYMTGIVNLFRYFDIKVTGVTEVENKKYENMVTVSYYISSERTNLIKYYDLIGYRYDVYKNIESGILVEYLKYIEKQFQERKELINSIKLMKHLPRNEIAEKLGIDTKVVYNLLKLTGAKVGLPKGLLTVKEWRSKIKYASTTIFLPLESKKESAETIISDITTVSANQSFLCGDTFCVHNSPRNCYQAAMGKQAMSVFAMSHLVRADTVTHVLCYPQKPLVSTKTATMMGFNDMPSGVNCIVAIACYTGFNQEDSIIMNKSAVDRGLFWAYTYRTHTEEEKKQGTYTTERIGIPPLDKQRRDCNYSLLDKDGVIRQRHPIYTDENGKTQGGGSVYVETGDVIIGKILVQTSKSGPEEISDASLVIKKGEEGYIDRIFTSITPNGYKLVKVVIRTLRIPEVGDKFACYDPETDILTQSGWKNITEISTEDKVACLIDRNKLEYINPTETQSYDFDGKMYQVDSDKVNLLVTPNHRMFTGSCHRKNYNIQTAEKIYGKMRSYKTNVENWQPENNMETFTLPAYEELPALELDLENWCIFFGIWIAEGCSSVSHKENGSIKYRGVHIAANKPRVQEQLEICMDVLGIKWAMHMSRGELVKWYSGDKRLIYYLKPLSVGAVNKRLPQWCFELDMYHSQKLIEGMVLGDGCYMKGTTTTRYYTSSIGLRDDLQQLCIHAGWSSNYYLKSIAGTKSTCLGQPIATTADYWSITICKTQTSPLVNKYIKSGKQLDSWVEYKGKVYCCSVPTNDGLVLVRRSGKPVWCGNSRTGQKGTLGMVYRQEDMPWTEAGIVPDIIMNPHAIPSRMTINQLMESVLGKSCCIEGTFGDSTPFTKSSVNIAEKLCDRLGMNDYDRTGTETLYNGMTGEVMGKVFIGPVCYQRLKHLVGDKIHARSQGPNASLTRQPLEGRSREGGLRFGEMERDCIISHGSAKFLRERLYEESDPYVTTICQDCGNFSTTPTYCKACDTDNIVKVNIPYVSKLVTQELNAMCIKCDIKVSP